MKKDEKLREGLNRLLSKQADPAKVEGVLNRLTKQETPTKEFRVIERGNYFEVWDDSVGFGIGFRKDGDFRRNLMYIRSEEYLSEWDGTDDEEMIQRLVSFAEEMFPREDGFRVEEYDKTRTIWDDSVGIGIRFEVGDRLARQNLKYIQTAQNVLKGDDDLNGRTIDNLISFAESRFPQEFGSQD